MRLDKFLKVSRVIKRRTIANDACDSGRVSINGKVAKASTEVKVADIVEIRFGEKLIKFEITSINEIANKVSADGMIKPL
jgi:ribosomal 50S subunit-recycling heat shock protein